jgi:murein DD-endopeptidase MepM/ murein hydrolase activator NlpD
VDAEQQPGLAQHLARDAASRVTQHLAGQALTKLAALASGKGSLIALAVIAAVVGILLVVVLVVSVTGAAFQSSMAVWPVRVATDAAGNYQASGWTISSRFGWRDDPQGGGSQFHDGLDLANPNGTCPFGYHCGAPAMFDGRVQYVGWDVAAAGDPSKTGGGEMVILENGRDDHETIYAHLEPYRLYVQLQGRIEDPYGRYDDYRDYQAIGHGPLRPDLTNGGIEMTCLNDMPNFLPTRTGAGTVVFLYDRPASCTTTVVWGQRGGDWRGWIADQPGGRAGDAQRAELRWQTPIALGQRAQDVALRFRAHLVPPPPPPPITDTVTLTPVPQPVGRAAPRGAVLTTGRGSASSSRQPISDLSPTPATIAPGSRIGRPRSCEALPGGWTRCAWSLGDIPTERERFASTPDPWIVAAAGLPQTERTAGAAQDDDVPSLTPAPPGLIASTAPRRLGALGRGGVATQSSPTPGPATRQLAATLDPPQVAPGASSVLNLAVTGGAPGTTAYVIIGMPQVTAQQLVATLPDGCFGSATLITCTVHPPASLVIPLTVLADSDASALELTIAVPPDGDQPQLQQSLQLRVVQDPPTVAPMTPTPISTATPVPPALPGGSGLDCAPQALVRLPDVAAPNPRLIAPAAVSFAAVRAEILERTGIDPLATLADALRAPGYTTSKAGVLQTSWHKAGRAIDLNQGGPFVRVAEGRMFRLYVGNVDITAIFEAHGWQRIPVQGDTAEWWHYEWHPDGIAWTSAMRQVWELATLQAAFPEIAWTAIGCASGANSPGGSTIDPGEVEDLCILGAPSYHSAIETFDGCGPPVRAGDQVYQLDSTLGFVGLTGQTTGPHLHLGLKVRSYDGSWPLSDICTPEWLLGRIPSADANCFTELADPLSFLPQAPGNNGVSGAEAPALRAPGSVSHPAAAVTPTPIIPEGAPYQLPPPNFPSALVFTPVPNSTPVGQYWSPYADGGQYGGGGVGQWFCANVWRGFPWCN